MKINKLNIGLMVVVAMFATATCVIAGQPVNPDDENSVTLKVDAERISWSNEECSNAECGLLLSSNEDPTSYNLYTPKRFVKFTCDEKNEYKCVSQVDEKSGLLNEVKDTVFWDNNGTKLYGGYNIVGKTKSAIFLKKGMTSHKFYIGKSNKSQDLTEKKYKFNLYRADAFESKVLEMVDSLVMPIQKEYAQVYSREKKDSTDVMCITLRDTLTTMLVTIPENTLLKSVKFNDTTLTSYEPFSAEDFHTSNVDTLNIGKQHWSLDNNTMVITYLSVGKDGVMKTEVKTEFVFHVEESNVWANIKDFFRQLPLWIYIVVAVVVVVIAGVVAFVIWRRRIRKKAEEETKATEGNQEEDTSNVNESGETHTNDAETETSDENLETVLATTQQALEAAKETLDAKEQELKTKVQELEAKQKALDAAQQALGEEREKLAEAKNYVEKLEKDISQKDDELQETKGELAEANKRIETATMELERAHEEHVRQIEDRHHKDIRTLNDDHKAEIDKLTILHQTEVDELNDKHNAEIEKKQNEYQTLVAEKSSVETMWQSDREQVLNFVASQFEFIDKYLDNVFDNADRSSSVYQLINQLIGTSYGYNQFKDRISSILETRDKSVGDMVAEIRTFVEENMTAEMSWINNAARLSVYASTDELKSVFGNYMDAEKHTQLLFDQVKILVAIWGITDIYVPQLFKTQFDEEQHKYSISNLVLPSIYPEYIVHQRDMEIYDFLQVGFVANGERIKPVVAY